jgi:hypothetical protein
MVDSIATKKRRYYKGEHLLLLLYVHTIKENEHGKTQKQRSPVCGFYNFVAVHNKPQAIINIPIGRQNCRPFALTPLVADT